MTRTVKAYDNLSGLSHSFLREHNEYRSAMMRCTNAVGAYRFAYLDGNSGVSPANAHTPNVFGVLADPTDAVAGEDRRFILQGWAYAKSQCGIEPLLPLKASEGGRVVNGVIKLTGGRALLGSTSGESGEITQSNGSDLAVQAVSNSTADTSQEIRLYVKQKTTGAAKMLYAKLNGTTAVTFKEIGGTDAVFYVDEVYGARMSAAAAGTVTIKTTAPVTLITMAPATTTRGMVSVAAADQYKTFYRKAQLTLSGLGADEVFVAGIGTDGTPQYEIIASAAANLPLRRETVNRWASIEYLVLGKLNAARSVSLAGLPSNEWKTDLHTGINHATYTSGNQPGAGAAQTLKIVSDEAVTDIGQKVILLGYNVDTAATVYDELTLNGTTAVASASNYTHLYGAYVSSGTPVGTLTITKNDGVSAILVFDTATYNTAGLFQAAGADADTGVASLIDINGANGRPVLTLSNTASTISGIVYGEDVDGTAQYELFTLVNGVAELVNAYSRILAIAAVGAAATEYLKVSHEQEDSPGTFCGIALGAASAQDTQIDIWAGTVAWQRLYGSAAERVLVSEIVGPGGVTKIDTLASTTRTITIPDGSGGLGLLPTTVIDVGANGHYPLTSDGLKAAITAASAGDTIRIWGNITITTPSVQFSKALTVLGMTDDCTITSALAADATADITAADCEFRDIKFAHSNNGAGDIALFINNVGAKLFGCEFDGGTNAAGIALDINADGADVVEFHNCKVLDGIIDADGNAASIFYWHGGRILDAVNLDTGLYYFYDTNVSGAFTTGAAAAATVELYNTSLGGALTITASTAFKAVGCSVAGNFVHTAGTATVIADMNLSGSATVTNATSFLWEGGKLGSTLGQVNATRAEYRDLQIAGAATITDGTTTRIINCAFADKLDSTASGAMVVEGCSVAVASTWNHNTLNVDAHGSSFTQALVITDAQNARLYDNLFANALTANLSGTMVLRDSTVIAASVWNNAALIADISGVRFLGDFTLTDGELIAKGCNVAGNFVHTAGTTSLENFDVAGTVSIVNATVLRWDGGQLDSTLDHTASTLTELRNLTVTGAATLTNATVIRIFDSVFVDKLDSTVTGSQYIENCQVAVASAWNHNTLSSYTRDAIFTQALTVTDAANAEFHNTTFTDALTLNASGNVELHGGSIGTASVWNNAALSVEAYGVEIRADLTVTSAALVMLQGCYSIADPLLITAATSVIIRDSFIADLVDMNGGTVAVENSTLEEIDHDGGDLTLSNSRVTAAVATDTGGSLSANQCHFGNNLVNGAGAVTVNLRDTHVVGALTNTAGTFNVSSVTVEGVVTGAMTPIASSKLGTKHIRTFTAGGAITGYGGFYLSSNGKCLASDYNSKKPLGFNATSNALVDTNVFQGVYSGTPTVKAAAPVVIGQPVKLSDAGRVIGQPDTIYNAMGSSLGLDNEITANMDDNLAVEWTSDNAGDIGKYMLIIGLDTDDATWKTEVIGPLVGAGAYVTGAVLWSGAAKDVVGAVLLSSSTITDVNAGAAGAITIRSTTPTTIITMVATDKMKGVLPADGTNPSYGKSAGDAKVSAVADGATTKQVVCVGTTKAADAALVQAITLNGTTPAQTAAEFKRVYYFGLGNAEAARTITITQYISDQVSGDRIGYAMAAATDRDSTFELLLA